MIRTVKHKLILNTFFNFLRTFMGVDSLPDEDEEEGGGCGSDGTELYTSTINVKSGSTRFGLEEI